MNDEMLIDDEEGLLKPIGPSIKRLGIKLGGEPREENIAQVLAEFISKQKNIQELVLTLPNMLLGDQGMKNVIESMNELEYLSVLFIELRKDNSTDEGVKALGTMLKSKNKLVQLGIDVAGNSLTAEMCRELGAALEGLTQLKFLALNCGSNKHKE